MIGMSPAAMGGFWNPEAKNARLEFNGAPVLGSAQNRMGNMRRKQPMMMSNPNPGMMRIQAPGLVQAPGLQPTGNEAMFPPISPSRNMLSRHMQLPTPQPGGEIQAQMPSMSPMAGGVLRKRAY